MDSIKSWLLEQFPDYEQRIHELWGIDMPFQQASHALQQSQLKLDRLNSGADPAEPGEVEAARERHARLREEFMTMIGPNLQ